MSKKTKLKPIATAAEPEPKHPKRSALDAAATVLADHRGEGMTSAELIEQMAARGLWTSPGGKTPAATLYAAMLREITKRGEAARFRKVSAGRFAAATKRKPAAKNAGITREDPVDAGLAADPTKPAARKGRRAKAGLEARA